MAKQIDDFCLDVISDIQQYIIEHTLYLNDEDTIDIDTFIAHWLLTEVTSMKMKEVKQGTKRPLFIVNQ